MKSFQVCLLAALLVICASNPLPQEAASSTAAPDAAKASPVPAVAATDAPLQKALDNEKIPEPQALPSKKEDAAPQKTEEQKREAPPAPPAPAAVDASPAPESASPKPAAEQPKVADPVAQPVSQPENVGKSLPQQEQAPESASPKPVENASPAVAAATPAEPAPTQQAVESTVVPVVPAAIASEKKINAGLFVQQIRSFDFFQQKLTAAVNNSSE